MTFIKLETAWDGALYIDSKSIQAVVELKAHPGSCANSFITTTTNRLFELKNSAEEVITAMGRAHG